MVIGAREIGNIKKANVIHKAESDIQVLSMVTTLIDR
jgi:hypothetical protein